jgi:tRNA dimethylallyltransferase
MSHNAPLIVILGPTAVGKTEIAISVAEEVNGEIISADSRTFYRGMDIGTAKPTPEQRRRVPHHLIDVADPDEDWSLVRFSTTATDIINDIHNRNKIPFLVGGTGQYIKAIVEGWDPPPREEDNTFREEMEKFVDEEGRDSLHRRLAMVDPLSAERIHSTNVRRVIRALEIYQSTGVPASQQRMKSSPPYEVLQIGLHMPREQLYQRVDERIDLMIANGIVEEVKGLLDKGYTIEIPSMSAIGYRQIGRALLENSSIDDAVQEMRKLTRQFVRRQANWFKVDDPDITWFKFDEEATRAIIRKVQSFLQKIQ